jgi:hypothetical protein
MLSPSSAPSKAKEAASRASVRETTSCTWFTENHPRSGGNRLDSQEEVSTSGRPRSVSRMPARDGPMLYKSFLGTSELSLRAGCFCSQDTGGVLLTQQEGQRRYRASSTYPSPMCTLHEVRHGALGNTINVCIIEAALDRFRQLDWAQVPENTALTTPSDNTALS